MPIFTSGQNHVSAIRALGAGLLSAPPISRPTQRVFTRYFVDAGFDVRSMEGIDVHLDKVPELPSDLIYDHIVKAFEQSRDGNVVYMLGSAGRRSTLSIG